MSEIPLNDLINVCARKTWEPMPAPCDTAFQQLTTSTEEEDVLLEALRLTSGDRQAQYGPPDQDFTRTAGMWSALFGHKLKEPFEARDVAMAMICLKLSRETHQRKRDNATDIAGYARCMDICNQADVKRSKDRD